MPARAIDHITIRGFKSFDSLDKLALRPINILIGANGSGKSNFIGVFGFLHAIREARLSNYVTAAGGAEKVLHFGSKATSEMQVDLSFSDGTTRYSLMHEFEGLSFSDCAAFCRGIGRVDLERSLRAIRNSFQTPEEINDSSLTAPSKRINGLFPGYSKPLYGNIGILEIGLDRIRAQCPHFAAWLNALERSATPSK